RTQRGTWRCEIGRPLARRWLPRGTRAVPPVPRAQLDGVIEIRAQRGEDQCDMLHGNGRLRHEIMDILETAVRRPTPLGRRPDVLPTAHAGPERQWQRDQGLRA